MSKETVLITGAGIGIGRSTALIFAKNGYHVFVTDILEQDGLDTVKHIQEEGGSAEFHYLDVTDTSNVNSTVEIVENRFGALGSIVANAGIAHKVHLDDMSDDKWNHTLDVDLSGVFRVCRAALPAMQSVGKGSIVALSSVMGTTYGWHDHVQYNAAKSGVVGLVRGLACDIGANGIRINGVAPGFIKTAQALSTQHSVGLKGLEAASEYIPLNRYGEPEDIAGVIVFLCADGARYMTGQTIIVDGGLTVGRY